MWRRYPKRPAARDEAAAKELKFRTLTNLCNSRPQWLADAHAVFDAAVSAAYGWDTDITESDALGNSVAVPYLHPLPPHRTEWMTCTDGSRGRAIEPMETDE